jgi:hypothetical protein
MQMLEKAIEFLNILNALNQGHLKMNNYNGSWCLLHTLYIFPILKSHEIIQNKRRQTNKKDITVCH